MKKLIQALGIGVEIFLLVMTVFSYRFGTVIGVACTVGFLMITGWAFYVFDDIAAYFTPKTADEHDALHDPSGHHVQIGDACHGDHAITQTALRPHGTILYQGCPAEACTAHGYIPAKVPVIILRCENGAYIVKPVEGDSGAETLTS